MLKLILLVASATIFVVLVFFIFWFRHKLTKPVQRDIEKPSSEKKKKEEEEEEEEEEKAAATTTEELKTFEGGEDLTVDEILEAPGEVIGKSSYGTLYKASLQRSKTTRLLRFIRPAAAEDSGDGVVGFLGSIRHPNLVPLLGFYAGKRGEKLLVHPFFNRGNLADFIRVGEAESQRWEIIYKISLGVAKALDHLHSGLQKPVAHGNLKSKNILLNRNYEPHVSDFGLRLLLNPAATQEMLQVSAASGYKPPELIKMRDADERTDVYSYGKILIEFLSRKRPTNRNSPPDENVRNAVISDRDGDGGVSEERILRCFQLAEVCCSSSPALRPNFKEVIGKLEEIGSVKMD